MTHRIRIAAAVLAAAWMSIPPATAGADQTPGVRTARHVLIVANNRDPAGELPVLRYADDDGARFAELFEAAGARVELLATLDADSQKLFPDLVGRSRPPTRDRLRAALEGMFADIRQDRSDGYVTELYFVYTGHGKVEDGTGRLLLLDGTLSRQDLFSEIVAASPADHNHLIIDACHAYYLVMARGAWRDDRGSTQASDALAAYLDTPDLLARHPTTGVILSTAGTAEVHEWERYRAGIFSHELRSGLLGPADVDGDGRVRYGELEAFLAAANAGVENPRARVQVFVQPPAQDLRHPLVELRGGAFTHFLQIPRDTAGHIQVEDARGLAYADWNKAPDHTAYLALLYPPVRRAPRYFVRRGDRETSVELDRPGTGPTEIALDQGRLAPARSAGRGSVAESYRRELFSVPYGRAFVRGFDASRDGERIARLQRTAGLPAPPQHALDAAYLVAGALVSEDGAAHGLRLSYRWAPWKHAHLAMRLGWRQSSGGKQGNLHTVDDFDLQVGGGFHWPVADRVTLSGDLLVGNHWVRLDGKDLPQEATDNDSGDDFAPAAGLLLGVRVHIAGPLYARAAGGAFVVFAAPEKQEKTLFVPEGVFALGTMF